MKLTPGTIVNYTLTGHVAMIVGLKKDGGHVYNAISLVNNGAWTLGCRLHLVNEMIARVAYVPKLP